MSSTATVNISIGANFLSQPSVVNENTFKIDIFLQCPYCIDPHNNIGTWGTYETLVDARTRFRCKVCKKTFNIAKIPFWRDKLFEMIWKMAQLTIKDRIAIHSFAQHWNIPETSLRNLITEIKTLFASSFENAKQLEQRLNKQPGINSGNIRLIVYDEGFLKLLGINGYLLFTLDNEGNPLTLCIESDRTAETI